MIVWLDDAEFPPTEEVMDEARDAGASMVVSEPWPSAYNGMSAGANDIPDPVTPEPLPAISSGIIFALVGADFNTTDSQVLTPMTSFTSFTVTRVYVTNADGSFDTVMGGIYTSPDKGGVMIVPEDQMYGALMNPSGVFNPSLTPDAANLLTTNALYFSATVPQGSAATATIFVEGAIC